MKALEIKEFNKKLKKTKTTRKESTLKCRKANLKQSKR